MKFFRSFLSRLRARPAATRPALPSRRRARPTVEGLETRELLAASLTTFDLPPGVTPSQIAAGPDAALWFTQPEANKIGRISLSGAVSEFTLPSPVSQPLGITAGRDGNLWFTQAFAAQIGRISPAGVIREFPIPSGSLPSGIALGPDEALWFTLPENDRIGRIDPASGAVKEFPLPFNGGRPTHITAGADQAMWFTLEGTNQIGRIGVAGAASATFLPVNVIQVPSRNAGLSGITLAQDGTIWFTQSNTDRIGRVTQDGTILEFPAEQPVDDRVATRPTGITSSPNDGLLYFVQQTGNRVVALKRDGTLGDQVDLPANSQPAGITNGPHSIWVTLPGTSQIGVVSVGLSPDLAFIQSLYVNALGRLGNVEVELPLWLPTLARAGREAVALAINSSEEAVRRTVRDWYGTYLRRPPVNGEETPWVDALLRGASEEEVLAGILSSDEFLGRARLLITNGTSEERYVRAVYSLLLRRSATPAEVAQGVQQIRQTGSRVQVALDRLFSTAYRSSIVARYYRDLLNRTLGATPEEIDSWVFSGRDLLRIRAGIQGSIEYYLNG